MQVRISPVNFKLYSKRGKTIMTQSFDDVAILKAFQARGKIITFTLDTVIEIAQYETPKRAAEICNEIVTAYLKHRCYSLPP